jgi:hypothetical protein
MAPLALVGGSGGRSGRIVEALHDRVSQPPDHGGPNGGGTTLVVGTKSLRDERIRRLPVMNDLLNKHYPKNVTLPTSNLFPLLDAAGRKVFPSF